MNWIKTLPARIAKYLREVRAEMKKVIWPGRTQTVLYTIIVLASVLVVAGMIWIVDNILSGILNLLLRG